MEKEECGVIVIPSAMYTCIMLLCTLTFPSVAPHALFPAYEGVVASAAAMSLPHSQPPTPVFGMSMCCVGTCTHVLIGCYLHVLVLQPFSLCGCQGTGARVEISAGETSSRPQSPIPALGMSMCCVGTCVSIGCIGYVHVLCWYMYTVHVS